MCNRKNKNGTKKTTMNEIIAQDRSRMNAGLWGKAVMASSLAKTKPLQGRKRSILYDIKHRCLTRLIERGQVIVDYDRWWYPGLLSVQLDPLHLQHTHANWLRPHRDPNDVNSPLAKIVGPARWAGTSGYIAGE